MQAGRALEVLYLTHRVRLPPAARSARRRHPERSGARRRHRLLRPALGFPAEEG